MTTYCPHCAFKNIYSGVKPKDCQSCGELLERKVEGPRPKPVTPRDGNPGYDPIEQDETGIDFELDPGSIKVQRDGGFMTIGALRTEGGAAYAERGGINQDLEAVRQQTLDTLLGGKSAPGPNLTPPPDKKPRTSARIVPSRIPPPA